MTEYKMAKTEKQLVSELKQKKAIEAERKEIDSFIKAYDEATKNLAEKHGYQMVPYLEVSNPFAGITPRLYPHKVILTNTPANEKTDTPAD